MDYMTRSMLFTFGPKLHPGHSQTPLISPEFTVFVYSLPLAPAHWADPSPKQADCSII